MVATLQIFEGGVFNLRFKSIMTRIIASVVPFIVIPTVLFILVSYNMSYENIDASINDRMMESLQTANLSIQAELVKNAAVADSFSVFATTHADSERYGVGAFSDFLLGMIPVNKNTIGGGIWFEPHCFSATQEFFCPYVFMEDGNAIFVPDYETQLDYLKEGWYLDGKNSTGELVWSAVYHDPVPNITMVTSTRAFYDKNGAFMGVATSDMALTDIRNLISDIKVGGSGSAFLLGQEGEYIHYFDDVTKSVEDHMQTDNDPEIAALGTALLASDSGITNYNKQGVPQRVYFMRMDDVGWLLAITIDESEISRSSVSQMFALAVIPLIGLVLAVLSLFNATQRLRRVAQKVNNFAKRVAAGDLTEMIEVTEQDEFGEMETHLNIMLANMDRMSRESAERLDLAHVASRAKTDFLSNMSHEMRTPMNAIIGMTSIGLASSDVDRKNYAFSKISEASTHLLGVINDVLDMSKIEADKMELSAAEFNFERVLQKVVDVINFRVAEKSQEFSVKLDRNIPQNVIGDDQRLAQVLTNLLANAVKFTPENGAVRLTATLLDETDDKLTLQVRVSDTGIGISPEQQSRLFASFQQAENSTSRQFGGTGLGLAISKHIVEMMGGRIWVESELGQGAAFIFEVTLGRGTEVRSRPLNELSLAGSELRLLVVDDMADVCDYFERIARRFELTCDTAMSGADAIKLIQANGGYDIYFIDWKMPDMSGAELVKWIDDFGKGDASVVMMSASEWNVIEEDVTGLSIDRYLSKPLFPSAIVDCINECMGVPVTTEHEGTGNEYDDNFSEYRILLAEDVEINQEIVLALLEPTELHIDCASNGEEAVALYAEDPERYDMIFMDLQMPKMDGFEATRRIRAMAHPLAKLVPIVAMTANVFREDIEMCIAAGMDNHVGKPLDLEVVMGKLRLYLKGIEEQ